MSPIRRNPTFKLLPLKSVGTFRDLQKTTEQIGRLPTLVIEALLLAGSVNYLAAAIFDALTNPTPSKWLPLHMGISAVLILLIVVFIMMTLKRRFHMHTTFSLGVIVKTPS